MKKLNCHQILLAAVAAAPWSAIADSYGVFDARTLALGGTGVALGSLTTGHFYNPALTSFHQGHEDRTRDGSHSFHMVLASVSDGARTAADAISDDLEGQLSDAIDNLNEDLPETARAGIAAARALDDAMRSLNNKSINADGYLGYSISLPADLEGGAFFIGSRFVGRGISDIADADFQLLQDYIEVLQFIETGGAEGVDHPELRDDDGDLIDPSLRIQSSAAGTGALLSELGVSAAKQYPVWGQSISLGIAPKVVYLRLFNESWRVEDGEFQSSGENLTEVYFNLDAGAAVTFDDVWRVGLAIKDIRSKSVITENGDRITLKPHARLGLAYIGNSLSVGLDADLDKIADLRQITERQEISLGAEYRLPLGLALRAGYAHDLEGSVDGQISAGFGWEIGRVHLDLAYAKRDTAEGAALHLGWAY